MAEEEKAQKNKSEIIIKESTDTIKVINKATNEKNIERSSIKDGEIESDFQSDKSLKKNQTYYTIVKLSQKSDFKAVEDPGYFTDILSRKIEKLLVQFLQKMKTMNAGFTRREADNLLGKIGLIMNNSELTSKKFSDQFFHHYPSLCVTRSLLPESNKLRTAQLSVFLDNVKQLLHELNVKIISLVELHMFENNECPRKQKCKVPDQFLNCHCNKLIWEKIGNELNISERYAMDCWNKLSKQFKLLLRRRKVGSTFGAVSGKEWPYFVAMSFMLPKGYEESKKTFQKGSLKQKKQKIDDMANQNEPKLQSQDKTLENSSVKKQHLRTKNYSYKKSKALLQKAKTVAAKKYCLSLADHDAYQKPSAPTPEEEEAETLKKILNELEHQSTIERKTEDEVFFSFVSKAMKNFSANKKLRCMNEIHTAVLKQILIKGSR